MGSSLGRKSCIKCGVKAATVTLLVANFAWMIACQGVSAGGGTGQQTQQVGSLSAGSGSLSFGSVQVGSEQNLTETVTNTGTSSVLISPGGISGTGFSLSGVSGAVTLASGQSTTFTVSFSPQAAGAASGTVTIASDATDASLGIPLSGTGTTTTAGQLVVSPGTLGVGNVVVGNSGSAKGTLTASGTSVTVSAASTNNSAFSIGGISLPATIPAGQSASFTVTFSPQTTGTASASLSFTSNAQSSVTETLTGTGTAPPTHHVNLSWNASTTSGSSGYNVYRAAYANTACGAFSRINALLNTTTLYNDSTVVDGSSYCYATTAVDSSNQESGYSNIISNLQIPPP